MNVLLAGNCILEKLSEILTIKGHEVNFTYMANRGTLFSFKFVEMVRHFNQNYLIVNQTRP